jgi:hypothetical protein
VTLWGEKASSNPEQWENNPIVAFKVRLRPAATNQPTYLHAPGLRHTPMRCVGAPHLTNPYLSPPFHTHTHTHTHTQGVKVSDFGGRTLGTIPSSQVSVQPDLPEAVELYNWSVSIAGPRPHAQACMRLSLTPTQRVYGSTTTPRCS